MESLLSVDDITVAGALVVAVVALATGVVSPRYVVAEMRQRAKALEEENTELNTSVQRLTLELGRMRIENEQRSATITSLRAEIAALRTEMAAMRGKKE